MRLTTPMRAKYVMLFLYGAEQDSGGITTVTSSDVARMMDITPQQGRNVLEWGVEFGFFGKADTSLPHLPRFSFDLTDKAIQCIEEGDPTEHWHVIQCVKNDIIDRTIDRGRERQSMRVNDLVQKRLF